MNDLQAPPVPSLSDLRISTRQAHLVREITMHRRHQRRGSLAVGGGALVAGGVATVVLVLAGPGTPARSRPGRHLQRRQRPAKWRAPRRRVWPGPPHRPPGAPTGVANGTTQVSLVDTRGPFTLVLFGANTSTQGVLLCVTGPSVSPSTDQNSHMSQSIGSQPTLPGVGQIALDRLQTETADDGQPYTIAEGSVGSGVIAAR